MEQKKYEVIRELILSQLILAGLVVVHPDRKQG
jgi:hypothetical protein